MDVERYRQVEQRFWAESGVAVPPAEHRIRLQRNGVSVRVMEVGAGPPTLFLHGGPNAGSTWALLIPHLSGRRCLVLDRPGTGLSDSLPLNVDTIGRFAETLVVDVLDALEVDRADIVASSFGGYIALRSAAAHPERIGRMVQMGCPAFVPGMSLPPFMRVMLVPGVRQLLNVLPPNERVGRMTLRQIGHGKGLDAHRIPQVFFDWYLALQRYTDTFRNEMAMIAALGSLHGFHRSLTLTEIQLGAVRAPTFFLWGADDSFGGAEAARRLIELMPHAELELLPDSGHLPWLDDPRHAGEVTGRFLTGRPAMARPGIALPSG